MEPHIPVQSPEDEPVASGPGRPHGRHRFRIRTALLGIAVLAAWLAALRVDGVPTLLAFAAGAVGLSLAVFASAAALGLLGFGLVSLYDLLAARVRRWATWPDDASPDL